MNQITQIENTFGNYMNGIRVILLIKRKKDGGERADNDFYKKFITTNKEEFLKSVKYLLDYKQWLGDETLRIYSCLNKRNINKAIREYKHQQLDADYYDEQSKIDFYLRTKDRFISCLMKPSCAGESLFLFDCDTLTNKTIGVAIDEMEDLNIEILHHYRTKSGFHIISKPFNPVIVQKLSFAHEIKKDSLILLSY